MRQVLSDVAAVVGVISGLYALYVLVWMLGAVLGS